MGDGRTGREETAGMEEKITEISGLPLTAEYAAFGTFEAGVAAAYSFARPSIHAKDEAVDPASPGGASVPAHDGMGAAPPSGVNKPPIATPARRGGLEASVPESATESRAGRAEAKAPAAERTPSLIELAPEAEPSAAVRAVLSKLSPKPRKSCRECRQSPATVKGDRTFVECTLSTCSAGFSGYQADLYHAPGKFCSHCLVRRYAYTPAAMDPATFKCPICTNAKVCTLSPDATSTKLKSSAPTCAPAAQPCGQQQAASSAGSGGPSTRKRSRVRSAKRRQATPMTPLLSVGTAVMTEEGLSGVIRGSGNGFFNVELTRGDGPGTGDRGEAAQVSPVVVKRRGTALRLRTDSVHGRESSDEDQARTSSSKRRSISHDSSGGDLNAASTKAPHVLTSEDEELHTYTDGLRTSDILSYIASHHPRVLQEAIDAARTACGSRWM